MATIDNYNFDPLLAAPKVLALVGIGKSLLYEEVRNGRFPKPVSISKGRVGWRASEIDAWIKNRPTVDPCKPPKGTDGHATNVAA